MKRVTVNGIELAFVERGRGVPLVLVHGFPLDHTMWEAQMDTLSEDYHVLAPDLRGFGKTGVTEGVVTMGDFAEDLAGLLDALQVDVPVGLCGLSMGGYVAFEFWRKHAARLGALVLCDTRAAADTAEAAQGRLQVAERVLREGPAPLVDGLASKLLAESTVESRPEVVDALRQVMMGTDRKGIAAAARGMAQRSNFAPMLQQIRVPTLVLVGQHDVISTPVEMRSIAQAIPGARFVEIAGCGHMSPMEKPAQVNTAILEFLGAAWKTRT
jgi:pimeloyl-ACP methyl ester carboxylesterase